MIHFISRYFYELDRNRVYWLTRAERRRAFRLCCILTALITLSVLMWVIYK
jgi:hypothetical protein